MLIHSKPNNPYCRDQKLGARDIREEPYLSMAQHKFYVAIITNFDKVLEC